MRKVCYILWPLLFVFTIAADQLLKYWTVTHLELWQSRPFIPYLLQLTRVHNTGAAWSSFSGQTVLLVCVNVVLLSAVIFVLVRRIVRHPLGVTACVLILGGGIGNIIDRLRLGYVVDMFELLFMDFPVFNLADCFLVVGTILGCAYYLWIYETHDAPKKEGPHGTDDPAGRS